MAIGKPGGKQVAGAIFFVPAAVNQAFFRS
jgi:hypothetical protein